MLKLLLIIGGFALGLVFNVQGIEGWHLFVEMSIFFMLVNSDIGAGLYHFSHEVIKNFPTAVVSAITPFMGSFLATFVFVYMFSDGMEMITILAICLAVGLIFTATALPIAISFNSIYGNDKVKKTLASVSSTDDVLSLVLSSVVAIALGGLLGSAEASNRDDNVLVEIILKLGSLLTFGFLLFLLMKYIKNLKAVYSFILREPLKIAPNPSKTII